jgi:hypothetical protein
LKRLLNEVFYEPNCITAIDRLLRRTLVLKQFY